MSKGISLKAACADSFYYPAEWDPSKGSLDHFQRKRGFEHHFGKQRTKNLHKGILQIRFEMPFKVQCLRCSTYIGQGTRYDADKKRVGKYFSTPLYEFTMHCGVIVPHTQSADGGVHCNQRFVIRTDPQNDDYELAEGLRRKVETWDPEDTETAELVDPETRRKMKDDPMFHVEMTIRDKEREKRQKARIEDLEDLLAEREDDFTLNCNLRKAHRIRRKEEQTHEEFLRSRPNFVLPLSDVRPEDRAEAAAVVFKTDHEKVAFAARRAAARSGPVLGKRKGGQGEQVAAFAELVAKRQRLAQHAKMERLFRCSAASSSSGDGCGLSNRNRNGKS